MCCIQDNVEPIASGMVQSRLEVSVSPNIRLRETIESRSKALMTYVTAPEAAGVTMKIPTATTKGNPSSATSGYRRRMLEIARRTERVEKEGRTNRCR